MAYFRGKQKITARDVDRIRRCGAADIDVQQVEQALTQGWQTRSENKQAYLEIASEQDLSAESHFKLLANEWSAHTERFAGLFTIQLSPLLEVKINEPCYHATESANVSSIEQHGLFRGHTLGIQPPHQFSNSQYAIHICTSIFDSSKWTHLRGLDNPVHLQVDISQVDRVFVDPYSSTGLVIDSNCVPVCGRFSDFECKSKLWREIQEFLYWRREPSEYGDDTLNRLNRIFDPNAKALKAESSNVTFEMISWKRFDTSRDLSSDNTEPRSWRGGPIIVVRMGGQLRVIDGRREVFRHIAEGKRLDGNMDYKETPLSTLVIDPISSRHQIETPT